MTPGVGDRPATGPGPEVQAPHRHPPPLTASAPCSRAPAAASPAPPYGAPITLEQAKAVVAAAEAEARKRNVAVTIVVVEPNGTIVLSERMSGAIGVGGSAQHEGDIAKIAVATVK